MVAAWCKSVMPIEAMVERTCVHLVYSVSEEGVISRTGEPSLGWDSDLRRRGKDVCKTKQYCRGLGERHYFAGGGTNESIPSPKGISMKNITTPQDTSMLFHWEIKRMTLLCHRGFQCKILLCHRENQCNIQLCHQGDRGHSLAMGWPNQYIAIGMIHTLNHHCQKVCQETLHYQGVIQATEIETGCIFVSNFTPSTTPPLKKTFYFNYLFSAVFIEGNQPNINNHLRPALPKKHHNR